MSEIFSIPSSFPASISISSRILSLVIRAYAKVTDDKISEDMDRLMQVRKANGLTKTDREE